MSDRGAYALVGSGRYVTAGLPVVHGFSTRQGGVSAEPYASLNLGLSSGDERHLVEANRDLLLADVGYEREQVLAFDQVHGGTVLGPGAAWFEGEGDAAVTDLPGVLLVVSVADCLPVLLHDPVTGAVGAAHCGWRGTALRLAARTAEAMRDRYGSRLDDVRAVIGPGVRGDCYQVGPELVERFAGAGFPAELFRPDATPDKYLLDLPAANRWALLEAGLHPQHVSDLGLCTHCRPDLFYSYRRDEGRTGRHWAFIGPRPVEAADRCGAG